MLRESLQYPQNRDEWAKTILIGGLLTLLSPFIVPAFVVFGYVVRVIRGTMTGSDVPPEFDEWGELTVDGLKAFVVAFVYGLVPAIVMAVFGGLGLIGLVAGANGDSGIGAAVGGMTAFVGFLLGLLLTLVAAYVVPAAIANFAETNRVGAAFDFSELRPILASGQYATAWLTAAVVVVAAGVVTGVLNAVPFLGFVAGAFVTFYALVAAYYIVGTTWGELHPVELREEGDVAGERPVV